MPVLALAAFLPRMHLATQLDMTVDERTYILAGKLQVPLLLHFDLTSPLWNYNYEHPFFVKLLIGSAIGLNTLLGQPLSELVAGRLPSVICGTLLILMMYWLGRKPLGHITAFFAALCLAFSPWLVFYSALAYLDIPMITLIALAFLLLWPAIKRPRLYLLSGALTGAAIASKYPAGLVLPGMLLFVAYTARTQRVRLSPEKRQPLPWRMWLLALFLIPCTFFLVDPSIWRQPVSLLYRSLLFSYHHAEHGHVMFVGDHYNGYAPHWTMLYIVLVKLSLFITLPAALFAFFALLYLALFHLPATRSIRPTWLSRAIATTDLEERQPDDSTRNRRVAFVLCWLLPTAALFSMFTIVVGTHYALPLAVPVTFAGTISWVVLLRWGWQMLPWSHAKSAKPDVEYKRTGEPGTKHTSEGLRIPITLALLTLILIVPHFAGLTGVYAADGYTSELFRGEDTTIQIAYSAYREAGLWLLEHTSGPGRVGLGAIVGTLTPDEYDQSWFRYNTDLSGRLKFSEARADSRTFPYDYLVWPLHLIQRGYALPALWRSHIVHTISGGNTIYCFITARDPTQIT